MATSASGDALLQLLKTKPPAKVDGLLQFVTDIPNQFTKEEQRSLLETDAGLRLAAAVGKCEGYKAKLKAARNAWSANKEDESLKRKTEESQLKYLDCLAYMSCPDLWKRYSTCWSKVSHLPPSHVHQLQAEGRLEVLCQEQRQSLEACIGSIVSNTVGASTSMPTCDNISSTNTKPLYT